MELMSQCALQQSIEHILAEIRRIQQVQKLIARADRALKSGRDDVLRALGFGDEHIAVLKKAASTSRGSAFPDYVRRNNARTVRYLRRQLANQQASLRMQMDAAPFGKPDVLAL